MKLLTLKVIVIFTVTFIISSCAAIGERFRIDTDKPVEDFFVMCMNNYDSGLLSMGASTYSLTGKTFMTNSDEESTCGIIINANRSMARISHPIYQETISTKESVVNKTRAGANIKEFVTWKERNKQALDLYESGYWDYLDSPNYLRDSITGYLLRISRCYISKEYLKNYNQEKTPDYPVLKSKYYNEILECNRENERLHHKHGKSSDMFYYGKFGVFGEQLVQCAYYPQHCKKDKEYLPERAIKARNNYMWSRNVWDPYINGSDEERELLTGKKKQAFIVAFGLPYLIPAQEWETSRKGHPIKHHFEPARLSNSYTKHAWLYIYAYNRKDISDKLGRDFTVFDIEPTWLSKYNKDNFINNCDGENFKIDIYALSKDKRNSLGKILYKIVNGEQLRPCINNIV